MDKTGRMAAGVVQSAVSAITSLWRAVYKIIAADDCVLEPYIL